MSIPFYISPPIRARSGPAGAGQGAGHDAGGAGLYLMPDFDTMRAHMVDSQILPNKVTDPRLIEALRAVPRELFVPEAKRGVAYVDEDLPLGGGRYLMEPLVFARLVEAAAVAAADTVLDLGCASGYSTAVLGRLAASVIGVESDPDLLGMAGAVLARLEVDNAVVVEGALAEGFPEQAPYDVILVNGAVATLPRSITAQLAEGGRLVTVIVDRQVSDRCHVGQAVRLTRHGGMLSRRPLFDAAVPPLPGFEVQPGFVF